ncbi:MAG: hypothetical protein JSC189_000217 [Candidatus Tokpelaia sp. JSC189]|nr:MAG: hypothetical protein JSC189_000217 [Candidatus Tokpelaia sp. JSC189]
MRDIKIAVLIGFERYLHFLLVLGLSASCYAGIEIISVVIVCCNFVFKVLDDAFQSSYTS